MRERTQQQKFHLSAVWHTKSIAVSWPIVKNLNKVTVIALITNWLRNNHSLRKSKIYYLLKCMKKIVFNTWVVLTDLCFNCIQRCSWRFWNIIKRRSNFRVLRLENRINQQNKLFQSIQVFTLKIAHISSRVKITVKTWNWTISTAANNLLGKGI